MLNRYMYMYLAENVLCRFCYLDWYLAITWHVEFSNADSE